MALACKLCSKELDAFSGGRCRKCRQLVCSNCIASGSSQETDGLLCKECAASASTHEVQQPVSAESRHQVKPAPAWLWILIITIIVGSFAYVIITPYISTQEAINAIKTGDDQEYAQALDVLSNLGGKYALNTLQEFIKSSPEPLRSRALRAIGALSGDEPVIFLKKLQTSDKIPDYLQSVIIEALLEHERRHSP